ncbi:MAG: hypothetical protein Q9217_005859 [Psora testacea]
MLLACDDECARLARNRELAQALKIDPGTHRDDHIPYSNNTMKMFRKNMKWAQTREREFRLFAADEREKRLRFKPMPAQQRAFLQSLSEDFGLDSESMDPDPHRHVIVFKTPHFVMAPMKTLAECLRIHTAEASKVAAVEPHPSILGSNEPFNGFLITQPRFGLTLEELRADYASSLDSTPGLVFDISFLPSEEIVMKARPASTSTPISSAAIEASIKALKRSLSATTVSRKLAGTIQLCSLDPCLNITRRELDDPTSNGGWSQVAAKGAAPRTLRPQNRFGQKSAYTVLGSKLKDAKKKKEEVKKALAMDVVDDWEEEVRREEDAATAEGDVENDIEDENVISNDTQVNYPAAAQPDLLHHKVVSSNEEDQHQNVL